MKLLTKTNRYYFLLSTLLFGLGSLLLYVGLQAELANEVEEQLLDRQQSLTRQARRTGQLPASPFDDLLSNSATPLPLGLRDTLILDPLENEQVPFRTLTFVLRLQQQPHWVTLRKSLLETKDVLEVLFGVMTAVLALLLLSVVLLNRWLSYWLWAPFQHTLSTLRGYNLQRRQSLALPATDIDEFAELNQALTQMSARLETDYRGLKEFTENAAHETQTPLAIMRAKLEQLMQLPALAHGEAAPLLSDLYGATLRLSRLHQGLTLLSKIENRQFPAATPVQLEQVITEKVEQLRDFIEDKQLTLTLHLTASPALLLHPALADSLVSNLLQNAVKHNHPGGTLSIFLTAAQLEVVNTGPPLPGPPEQFFARFRKLQGTSDSPGLGLAIVKQICQHYGFALHYEVTAAPVLHKIRVVFQP